MFNLTKTQYEEMFDIEIVRFARQEGVYKQGSRTSPNFDVFLNDEIPRFLEHQSNLVKLQFLALTEGDLQTVARINGRLEMITDYLSRKFERNYDYD